MSRVDLRGSILAPFVLLISFMKWILTFSQPVLRVWRASVSYLMSGFPNLLNHFRAIAIMRDAAPVPCIAHRKLLFRSQMSGWRESDASDDRNHNAPSIRKWSS